ncbi:hypothetical protein [Candidatus Amarolinea dominans]|uniref:hypothetical protein n=1 Tax=Candidatus Amarolinea dominans TaxID=3140696 RepID=UPI001DB794B6|nr:hypothetical protein [Anaerolineae bacterium]
MTINRARAQALLEAAGHTDIKLPATLDGAPIAIDIPTAVVSRYGACRTARERQSQMDTCLILTQLPSPTVTTPPDLNMQELAAAGLQMAGLSPSKRRPSAARLTGHPPWSFLSPWAKLTTSKCL